jgi:hypothetical protein
VSETEVETVFPAFDELLRAVPDYRRFLTVDELEASTDRLLARRTGVVDSWPAGESAAGHPLRCIEVAGGPRRALLLGLVHGEEPVGTLLIEFLLPRLLETDLGRRLGFSWAIVKVMDPDAARLNEAWFAAPFDLADFVLNVYRSAYAEQPVWSFPVKCGRYEFAAPPPETKAVMSIIDRAPLDLCMSLHNNSFSGGYFYLSRPDDALCAGLAAVRTAAGIPAHCGEPEVPYLESLGDGIFRTIQVQDEYDYLERFGGRPEAELAAGCNSDEYAVRTWGCLALLAETPNFTCPQVADTSPAGMTRAEAKLRGLDLEEAHCAWLRERWAGVGAGLRQTPWLRAVAGYLDDCAALLPAERRQAETTAEFAVEATVAQVFDSVYLRELNCLTRLGQFRRALLAGAPEAQARVALCGEIEARVRERAAAVQAATGLAPTSIRARVQMQLGALLLACDLLRRRA